MTDVCFADATAHVIVTIVILYVLTASWNAPSHCAGPARRRGHLALLLPELALQGRMRTLGLMITCVGPGCRTRWQGLALQLNLHFGRVYGRRQLALAAGQLSMPPLARGRPPPGLSVRRGLSKCSERRIDRRNGRLHHWAAWVPSIFKAAAASSASAGA